MSPARGRYSTLLVLTATNRFRLTPAQPRPYLVLNHVGTAFAGRAAPPVVSVRGHPEGCSKISRGPALHQPGTNVAPTGALA
jgi:hypothetical protein